MPLDEIHMRNYPLKVESTGLNQRI